MKNVKKCLVLIFVLMVILPTCVFAAKKKNLVNVYVFEAGGCGWCAQEIEFLKGLPSYNKKFKIVEKELYESTSTWAQGKDYKLGSSVASIFYDQGFTDASVSGTPFMVISDKYAATGYYTGDEIAKIIDEAYDEGDKDVVKCVENDKDNCLSEDAKPVVTPSPTTTTTTASEPVGSKDASSNGIILLIVVAVIIAFIFISRKGNDDYYDDDDDEFDEDEDDDESNEDENDDESDEEEEDDDDDESDEDEDNDETDDDDKHDKKDTNELTNSKEVKKVNNTSKNKKNKNKRK